MYFSDRIHLFIVSSCVVKHCVFKVVEFDEVVKTPVVDLASDHQLVGAENLWNERNKRSINYLVTERNLNSQVLGSLGGEVLDRC